MSQPSRIDLSSVLVGDELGQIKLVQLDPNHNYIGDSQHVNQFSADHLVCGTSSTGYNTSPTRGRRGDSLSAYQDRAHTLKPNCSTWDSNKYNQRNPHRHRIVRILDDCLQREPAAARAITNIRPLDSMFDTHIDTTDKANNLFLVTNKVGQMFLCNTDAIRRELSACFDMELCLKSGTYLDEDLDGARELAEPILSPVYYNMSDKSQVCGGQPINQTNILVIYQNGDIQHVSIGQEVLQSSLKMKRKAIRMLGLSYNSDARAVHWRISGSSGICYLDTSSNSGHLSENDPLTDIVLSSPTHKLSKKRTDRSQHNLYNKSPCIKARKRNEQDRLVPTQVINELTSRAEHYNPSSGIFKWSSITSLNLIYRKLGLYDLVGSESFQRSHDHVQYNVNSFKLNDDRLAVGGSRYTLRVYDVQTQKQIYNCKTGASKHPLGCPWNGEMSMVGDIDWLGGNKTTRRSPNMLASVSGVDSVVKVYDLRSVKPVFFVDLTAQTENKWQPYENQPRGCMFTSICASGAPYSTAVPSQQLALGSTNGQLHIIDLRFVAKSHRTLGKLSGFCGGSIRELRFVSESFETSKMISCATDRFVRIHKIQTSFTSVVSQSLATKVFMGTKPVCIQPVCDELTQSYLATIVARHGSESHISTIGSGSWSPL